MSKIFERITDDSICESFCRIFFALLPLYVLNGFHPLPYGGIILYCMSGVGAALVMRFIYILFKKKGSVNPLLEKYVANMIIFPYGSLLCEAITSCYVETDGIGIVASTFFGALVTISFMLDLVKKKKADEGVTGSCTK